MIRDVAKFEALQKKRVSDICYILGLFKRQYPTDKDVNATYITEILQAHSTNSKEFTKQLFVLTDGEITPVYPMRFVSVAYVLNYETKMLTIYNNSTLEKIITDNSELELIYPD